MIRTEEACGWNEMSVASRRGPRWFFPTVTHPRVIPRLRHLQARGSFIYVQSSQTYSSWYCSNSIVSAIHRLTLTSIPDERSTGHGDGTVLTHFSNNPNTNPAYQPTSELRSMAMVWMTFVPKLAMKCPAPMTILRILRQPNLFAKDKPASRTSHHTRSRQQVPRSIHPRNAEIHPSVGLNPKFMTLRLTTFLLFLSGFPQTSPLSSRPISIAASHIRYALTPDVHEEQIHAFSPPCSLLAEGCSTSPYQKFGNEGRCLKRRMRGRRVLVGLCSNTVPSRAINASQPT